MPRRVTFTTRVSVPEGVLVQELDGESVIVNIDSGRYFGLDATGSRIWRALAESESIEHACQTLLAEFDVDEQRLRKDLEKLTGELSDHGLLIIAEVADSGNAADQTA